MDKKLHRSQTDKIIAGIAGGLGEHFEVDPTIVRLIFVLITVLGGSGVLLYLILWVLIPKNSEGKMVIDKDRVKEVAGEIKDKAEAFGKGIKKELGKESPKIEEKNNKSGGLFGWILIIAGILFLINIFHPFSFRYYIFRFWPAGLILLGMVLIFRSNRK
jgi:phage shock protein PspC (stress-responsive transcriptional regulator)